MSLEFTVWYDLWGEATGMPDTQFKTPVILRAEYCPADPSVGIMGAYLEDISADAYELTGGTKEMLETSILADEAKVEEHIWSRLQDAEENEAAYLESLEEDAAESNYACRVAYLAGRG